MNSIKSIAKYSALVILFFTLAGVSHAQTIDIKLFDKSKGNTLSEVDKNLAEYKKIQKENKAFLKEQRKKYKAHKDSLDALKSESIKSDSVSRAEKLQKQYFIYTNQWYDQPEIMSWDSARQESQRELLDYSKERLEGNYYYDKYMGMNNQITGYHRELKDFKDSLKTVEDDKEKREYLVILKKQELSGKYGKALNERAKKEAQSRAKIDFPTNNPELEKVLQYQDLAKEAIKPNQSKAKGVNYFEGKEEVLAKAMNQSNELKQKYSKVVNSNDLSTATKRKSLEGTSFWGRLVFGGTFQIHIDKQSSIDLNPELAYRINKKWDVGVGGNYRVNAAVEDLLGTIQDQKIYGYRIFTEYQLYKSFFGHVEFESLAARPTDVDGASVEWNNSLLAGIERRFKLGDSVEAQISLLYNFMHKSNPLYTSPWNIRFGFNLKGKDKKAE
ncbi:MAG: hypothetical protein ABJF04_03415 [Reichenbachiella sp.]|uniref:hypothetical protein n=1 Tax=Reichenbachiella sp. TaxID=2184521 RepID=UPI00326746B6